MKKSEYKNKPVIAVYGVCNTLAIEIIDIEYGIDDSIIYKYSNSDKIYKSTVYYRKNGDQVFRTSIGYIKLSECLRV